MDQIWPESLIHMQLNSSLLRKQNTWKLPTKLMIHSRNQRPAEPQATVTAWVTKAEEPLPRCLVVTELPPQLTVNPDMILLLAETLADSPETWIWVELMKIEI
jgi:hypothetical protein